ncbi:MAG TPA: GrpB family protein [Candidatus Dormibacteraeota bacterium]
MPILISDYDAGWPAEYERRAAAIRDALGPAAVRIEHVGSTSVPGLAAKPVIDIQLSVADLLDEASYRPALEQLGYQHRPDHEPEHRFFKLEDATGRRLVHIHVCAAGSVWERRHLAFRDRLRADPEAARRYEEVKRTLAPRFDDANQYADAKTEIIRSLGG